MTQKRGYQLHFSRGDFVLKEAQGRTQKFEKIISVLRNFNPSTPSLICLDIGCSSGIITSLLANHSRMSIGMDIDGEAVQYAQDHSSSPRVRFLTADSMVLPFSDNIYDYTLPIIRNPEKFFATDLFNPRSFLYKGIRWLAPYLYSWIPTYVWILTKK